MLAINFEVMTLNLNHKETSMVNQSYNENIKSIKYFVTEILQDYIKIEHFKTNEILKGQISEKIKVDKEKFFFLKNSYLKLSMLLMYYEKFLFDIFNKLVIDLSNLIS